MDDAAGPEAGALSPRFVCRISGAPADTVDDLRAEESLRLFGQLAEVDARVAAERERVSQLLFEAIGAAAEKPARNRLITLKRDLYNGKVPSAQKIDDALAGVHATTAAAVRDYVADLDRLHALEADLRRAHDEETAGLRDRFRHLVRDADFRKGLMVSSRALYGNLGRYDAAAASGELSGRDEKTERGLLRYYTRMAAKATPFATFCAIIPGAFVPGEDGAAEGVTTFTSDPRQKRSFVRANKFLYGLFFDHLKARPAFRHALAVERNPTLRTEGGRLVFLTAIDGREVFQRMGDNEVLQLIASRFSPGVEPTLGELIHTLSSDPEIDATPEEAEAYLDKLLEIGFLRFHTGIREQDADWDLPFRALLDRVDDDHARQISALLGTLRGRIDAYGEADVEGRAAVIDEIHEMLEQALVDMDVKARLRKDMPFYEDATSPAEARIALTPGVRRAFGAFEGWVRLTARLAWPRQEQATMRHFFETYYGSAEGVPLLKFYEDFYREHFKSHVEKEQSQRGGQKDPDGYDLSNPFNLEFVSTLSAARSRLAEAFRVVWAAADPQAEVIDVDPEAIREALEGVETLSGVPRSMGAFGLMVPAEKEGEDPSFILHGSSYTAGYGKYFSRFLYMLPDAVQEDVRVENAALTDELLAEICGDAQFNANLHPPLMKWEISYPTGESGETGVQLPSSEIVVTPDPEDPHVLRLVHAPTGRHVIPVDLGFLNPRMRPPLYQLLSRFTPPVMFAPTLPDNVNPPRKPEEAKPAAEGDAVDANAAAESPAADAGQVPAVAADADAPAAPAVAGAVPVDAVVGDANAAADAQPVAEGEKPAEAPAPPAPVPTIHYRPRITFGRQLVLARRRWVVPSPLLPQRRADESAADYFLRINRWRLEAGLPETLYVRINPLPEPRPQAAGQPAAEETPAEAPAEIPGYDGAPAEAEAHEEPEAEPAAAEAAAPEGEAKAEGDAAPAAAPKKQTQVSRDFFKPQFIDFGNPLVVGLLGRVGTGLKAYQAVFEERLPDRPGLPRHGADSYVTELVVQLYFPGGTASDADAGEELLAAATPDA